MGEAFWLKPSSTIPLHRSSPPCPGLQPFNLTAPKTLLWLSWAQEKRIPGLSWRDYSRERPTGYTPPSPPDASKWQKSTCLPNPAWFWITLASPPPRTTDRKSVV